MHKEIPIDPLSYTICIRVVQGYIIVSQPDLQLVEAELSWDGLKSFQQMGRLVANMWDRIIRTVSEAQARGKELPSASSPKEAVNIPKLSWVGIPEGAKYLDVSESTLRRLCNNGTIRCKRTKGNHRKINLEDLHRFKREGQTYFEQLPLPRRLEPEGEPLASFLEMFLLPENEQGDKRQLDEPLHSLGG